MLPARPRSGPMRQHDLWRQSGLRRALLCGDCLRAQERRRHMPARHFVAKRRLQRCQRLAGLHGERAARLRRSACVVRSDQRGVGVQLLHHRPVQPRTVQRRRRSGDCLLFLQPRLRFLDGRFVRRGPQELRPGSGLHAAVRARRVVRFAGRESSRGLSVCLDVRQLHISPVRSFVSRGHVRQHRQLHALKSSAENRGVPRQRGCGLVMTRCLGRHDRPSADSVAASRMLDG